MAGREGLAGGGFAGEALGAGVRLVWQRGEGGASPLSVEVEVLREGEKVGIAQYGRAVQWYLGFPLRGDKEWAPVKEGVAFRLRLRFPEKVGELNFWEELEAALWAWETFGGIGARTRRGFGALLPQGAGVPGEEEIREKLRQYGQKAGWPEGVPHLTPKSFVRVVPLSWRELAERYQAFRQARPGGTPEARAAPTGPSPTGCGASRGGTPPTTCPGTPCTSSPGPTSACPSSSTSRTGATPRHHPPAQGGRPPGEPPPLPPAWGRAEALRGGGPRGARFPGEKLVLEGKDGRTWDVDPWLTPEEAQKIPVLGGEVDPVLAFVKSL